VPVDRLVPSSSIERRQGYLRSPLTSIGVACAVLIGSSSSGVPPPCAQVCSVQQGGRRQKRTRVVHRQQVTSSKRSSLEAATLPVDQQQARIPAHRASTQAGRQFLPNNPFALISASQAVRRQATVPASGRGLRRGFGEESSGSVGSSLGFESTPQPNSQGFALALPTAASRGSWLGSPPISTASGLGRRG